MKTFITVHLSGFKPFTREAANQLIGRILCMKYMRRGLGESEAQFPSVANRPDLIKRVEVYSRTNEVN